MPEDFELEARKAKFALVISAMEEDTAYVEEILAIKDRESQRRPEGLAILNDFLAGGGIEEIAI